MKIASVFGPNDSPLSSQGMGKVTLQSEMNGADEYAVVEIEEWRRLLRYLRLGANLLDSSPSILSIVGGLRGGVYCSLSGCDLSVPLIVMRDGSG